MLTLMWCGFEFAHIEKTVTVGRDDSCDVHIRRPNVSRRHCRIFRSADGKEFAITDLMSLNGTRVNGQALEEHQIVTLQDGDLIQVVSGVEFQVQIKEAVAHV